MVDLEKLGLTQDARRRLAYVEVAAEFHSGVTSYLEPRILVDSAERIQRFVETGH